ncbi:MAG TPA: thiamine-phosphate kinase, partial [Thermoplasmata archaeon]
MPPHRRRRTGAALQERPFHRWLASTLTGPARGLLPVGDDAAALPLGDGRVVLLTSDALSEGTHFRPDSPPRSIGHAVAVVNLSDVAAKGGQPVAFLLDLLLPRGTPERWAREVTVGAEELLASYGAHLIGGDTKPSGTRAVVGSLAGIGRAVRLAPRSGARAGDVVVVTGAVGRGGFDSLAVAGGRRPTRGELARWLEVHPRVVEGPVLARFAHAMMDTSDGVADSARLLAEASRKKLILRSPDLPIYPRLTRRVSRPAERLQIAFFGGDYELMATLPREEFRTARRALARFGCPLTVVGRVERGAGAWIEDDRGLRAMPPAGWRPFGSQP